MNGTNYAVIAARVIRHMSGVYNTFPNDEDKIQAMCEAWSELFAEEELLSKHIERGLYWMRHDTSKTVPTPGKFLDWTKGKTPKEIRHEQERDKLRIESKHAGRVVTPESKEVAEKAIKGILQELTTND